MPFHAGHFVVTGSDSDWFGGGNGPIFYVSCDGTESSLKDCTYSNHISSGCDHRRDVGVQCVNLVTSGKWIALAVFILTVIIFPVRA